MVNDKTVAVIGMGGNGQMATLLLSSLHFKLKLIDGDYVEASNLERQPLFGPDVVGMDKVNAVGDALRMLGRTENIQLINSYIDSFNIEKLMEDVDFIIDATDSFLTRELINEYSVKYMKPWIYSSSHGSYGEIKTVIPNQTSCLNCITGGRRMVPLACHSNSVDPEVPSIVSLYAARFLMDYFERGTWDGDLYFFSLVERNITRIKNHINDKCSVCTFKNFSLLEERKLKGRQIY